MRVDWWRREQVVSASINMNARYGVRSEPHSRLTVVLISRTDYARLREAVMADKNLTAIGRGYFLHSVMIWPIDDWRMDPLSVSMARLAAILRRPAVRLVRWIDRCITRSAQ